MSARTEFPLTPRDAPDLRARVQDDLSRIVDAVRRRDPGAWSMILTGGFSRGEGTAIDGEPLNDYDLVVFRRAVPIPPSTYPKLTRRLEDRVGLHVDLLPVWRGRIRHLAPKVFWFDLKHGGQVIWGAEDALDRIPVDGADEIPPDEATRLLCNRAVGLLEALPGAGNPDDTYVHMQSAKALLASGEALLILDGAYHSSYRERERRLHQRLPEISRKFEQAHDLVPLHAWATAWKLEPTAYSKEDPGRQWEAARRSLLLTAEHAFPHAGWGPLHAYPSGAPMNPVDLAYYAARTRLRPPALLARPSHEARNLALALLTHARYPEGPDLSDPEVRRAYERVGLDAPRTWQEALDGLLQFRALTLQ